METSLTLVSAGLMMGFLAGGAQAAVLCSAGSPHPDGIAVTDMTFEGDNADDCYGVVAGNDATDPIWIDTGWTLFAKDDVGGALTDGTINGITFTLDALPDTQAKFGTWLLSWEETGLPGYDLTMDVIGVLKAGSGFASYLFEDLMFTADGSGSGTWEISYDNKGGQIPDLSHLSLYYKNVNSTSGEASSTSSTTSGDTGVPEPGVLGLLGIGLLGQALLLRQRRRRLQK